MSGSAVTGGVSSRYDGFISYSHAADDLLAPRLQAGLQTFAKPWWRRRALRIFRDESSLSANPHLWTSITAALDRSDWFVLLTSPEAAASPWVDREVTWWREHKDPERILPVLTEGEMLWDEASNSLDPVSSVPPSLTSAFSEEPRWVDLRWARTDTELDLGNTRFRSAIADIASTIRQIPKDELESEEVRQHRRTLRTAWGAAALLAALTVAAAGAALYANDQARVAEARGLAARATALAPTRIDLSLLLAVEGSRIDESLETRAGLLTSLNGAHHLAGFRSQITGAFLIDASTDILASISQEGEVQLWDTITWAPLGDPLGTVGIPISVDVSADGSHVAAGGNEGARVWNIATRDEMRPSSRPEAGPPIAILSPTGDMLLTADADDPVWRLNVWELPSGELLGSIDLGEEGGFGRAEFSPDSSRIYLTAEGGRVAVFNARPLEPIVAQMTLDDSSSGYIAVSPKGDLVATSSVFAPIRIMVRDAETLEPVGSPVVPRMGGRLYFFGFSPDGKRLLAQTDDGSVAVIDPAQGLETMTLTGRAGFGGGAAWLDSNRLVSSSSGAVMEWDLRRTTVIGQRTASDNDYGVASTSQGELLTVSNDGLVMHTADGTTSTVDLDMDCGNVFPSPEASLAALSCQDDEVGPHVIVVDLVKRTELWRQPLPDFGFNVAFSPDQTLMAITSFGGDLTILDAADGVLIHSAHLDDWLLGAVGWSPDGESLMVGGQDGSLYFLNVDTWEQTNAVVLEPNEIALMDLAIHPDQRRVFVTSESGLVWVVDLETRAIDGDPLDASGTQLQSLAISPDGSLVAATSRDGGIRLWETDSRRAVGPTLKGHAINSQPIDFGSGDLYTSGLESIDSATGEADISMVKWTLDRASLSEVACDLVGRNLTLAEWTEYVPDANYRSTCPEFPPGE